MEPTRNRDEQIQEFLASGQGETIDLTLLYYAYSRSDRADVHDRESGVITFTKRQLQAMLMLLAYRTSENGRKPHYNVQALREAMSRYGTHHITDTFYDDDCKSITLQEYVDMASNDRYYRDTLYEDLLEITPQAFIDLELPLTFDPVQRPVQHGVLEVWRTNVKREDVEGFNIENPIEVVEQLPEDFSINLYFDVRDGNNEVAVQRVTLDKPILTKVANLAVNAITWGADEISLAVNPIWVSGVSQNFTTWYRLEIQAPTTQESQCVHLCVRSYGAHTQYATEPIYLSTVFERIWDATKKEDDSVFFLTHDPGFEESHRDALARRSIFLATMKN